MNVLNRKILSSVLIFLIIFRFAIVPRSLFANVPVAAALAAPMALSGTSSLLANIAPLAGVGPIFIAVIGGLLTHGLFLMQCNAAFGLKPQKNIIGAYIASVGVMFCGLLAAAACASFAGAMGPLGTMLALGGTALFSARFSVEVFNMISGAVKVSASESTQEKHMGPRSASSNPSKSTEQQKARSEAYRSLINSSDHDDFRRHYMAISEIDRSSYN